MRAILRSISLTLILSLGISQFLNGQLTTHSSKDKRDDGNGDLYCTPTVEDGELFVFVNSPSSVNLARKFDLLDINAPEMYVACYQSTPSQTELVWVSKGFTNFSFTGNFCAIGPGYQEFRKSISVPIEMLDGAIESCDSWGDFISFEFVIVTYNAQGQMTPYPNIVGQGHNLWPCGGNSSYTFVACDFDFCNGGDDHEGTFDENESSENRQRGQLNENKFSPNPFNSYLQNINTSFSDLVIVYDVYGQEVYRSTGVSEIETGSWSEGLYILTISSNGKTKSQVLIKR